MTNRYKTLGTANARKSEARQTVANFCKWDSTAKRACNAEVRPRESPTPKKVEHLIKARYGARDGLAVLMAYRHGLRASELARLRWDQVDFDHGLLHVRRFKNGMDSVHPLSGDELRALRALRREDNASRFVVLGHKNIQHTVHYTELSPPSVRELLGLKG
jgi:integrase